MFLAEQLIGTKSQGFVNSYYYKGLASRSLFYSEFGNQAEQQKKKQIDVQSSNRY